MLWTLERFGTLALPTLEAKISDASGGAFQSGYVPQMHGGGWDQWQGGPAPRGPQKIEAEWWLLAATGLTAADTQAQYQALQFYAGGAPQRLYRRWVNGDLQWINARLLGLPSPFDRHDTLKQAITLQWESGDAYWAGASHGAGWLLDTGVLLDTGRTLDESTTVFPALSGGTATIHLPNGGNGYVRAVSLLIQQGGGGPGGNITSVRIVGGGADMTYAATWSSSGIGDLLVIDTGARRVSLNGGPGYGNFTIPVSPPSGGWMELAPGDNPLVVTWTSSNGGAPPWIQITATYTDAWL